MNMIRLLSVEKLNETQIWVNPDIISFIEKKPVWVYEPIVNGEPPKKKRLPFGAVVHFKQELMLDSGKTISSFHTISGVDDILRKLREPV